MKVIRHARYADRERKIEAALAVAGVTGGTLLWSQAPHFGGYVFATAAFLSLAGIKAGVRALRNYNRHYRGAAGEEAVLTSLNALTDDYLCVTNFVVPGTQQGDTDLLVLGPFGVLVVEIKAYTGHYACHNDNWYRVRPDGSRQPLRSNVSRQLKRNRKSIQHYLVDCEAPAPVYSTAVFLPGSQLDLVQCSVPILRQNELLVYISELPRAPHRPSGTDLTVFFTPTPPAQQPRPIPV